MGVLAVLRRATFTLFYPSQYSSLPTSSVWFIPLWSVTRTSVARLYLLPMRYGSPRRCLAASRHLIVSDILIVRLPVVSYSKIVFPQALCRELCGLFIDQPERYEPFGGDLRRVAVASADYFSTLAVPMPSRGIYIRLVMRYAVNLAVNRPSVTYIFSFCLHVKNKTDGGCESREIRTAK